MTAGERRRPSRNLQRRIRARQSRTGEPYMVAALAVEAEQARGQGYLSDPAVPAELAAEVRAGGFIPLEPFTPVTRGQWWCRCCRCHEVIDIRPGGHGYQRPGRPCFYLHDCELERQRRRRPLSADELVRAQRAFDAIDAMRPARRAVS